MKNRTSPLLLVLVAVAALVVGSLGTADAAGLTKSKVKQIATKVVHKEAPTLTVAKANTATTATTATTANGVANGAISSPGAFGTANLGVVRAYAWNNLAATSGTLSGNGYTYNRSGGTVTVTHNSAGNYTVTFTGLNLNGGNYQVSGYGGGAVWCKVGSWGSSTASVLCFNSAGAATDSLFTIAAIQ